MNAVTTPAEQPQRIEDATIQPIPDADRHGKARDLFTIWFGSNIMVLTIVTGALATTVFAQPFWSAVVAIVIGNLVGAIFMALHSAQGPRLGVPQMVQTRGQFGSYGSLLVILIVVIMYVGFFASNLVLGGQSLSTYEPAHQHRRGHRDRRGGERDRDDLRLRPHSRLHPDHDLPLGRGAGAGLRLDLRRPPPPGELLLERALRRRGLHGDDFRRRPLADCLCSVRLRLLPLHAEGDRLAARVLGELRRLQHRLDPADDSRRDRRSRGHRRRTSCRA